jgi:hypothetical protein
MPGPAVEVAVATMNTYPYDLPGRANWGSDLEGLVPMLRDSQCANVEVHPTRAIIDDVNQRVASGDTEIIDTVVGSQHQTFIDGVSPLGRIGVFRGVMTVRESLGGVAVVQSALSEQKPVIVFDDDTAPKDGFTQENTGAQLRVAQPSAELYSYLSRKYPDLDVRTNAGLYAALRRDGIIGFCPDLVHSRRKTADGKTTPPIEEVWGDQFASGAVYEMHVALDRRDMKGRDPELAALSAAEFTAFASGHWRRALKTQAGDMIVEAVRRWRPPADLPRPMLRAVFEMPPMPQDILRRPAQLARCVQSLGTLIEHAGGYPILWSTPSGLRPAVRARS